MDASAIMFDEVIESYNEETKPIPTNFNEKKAPCNFLYFKCNFINYSSIIDSC